MGQLRYGVDRVFDLDDRVLGHVEAAAISKLRRGESFALRLDDEGRVPVTIWLSAASSLEFSYSAERPAINRAWLEALVETANTAAGLRLVPEPSQG